MTDRRDKSGPWNPSTSANTFYMGDREWYFKFEDTNLDAIVMARKSARIADKAIENMMTETNSH